MSSSDRRTILGLMAALPLAACGFRPAYAPGGPAAILFEQVEIDAPADKNAFDLVERLEERLGRPTDATFRLSFTIMVDEVGVAVTPENAITRYNILGETRFALQDLMSGDYIVQDSVNSFTAYSASGTTVSTTTAERDAYERLMRIMADQIVTRLIATLGQQ